MIMLSGLEWPNDLTQDDGDGAAPARPRLDRPNEVGQRPSPGTMQLVRSAGGLACPR